MKYCFFSTLVYIVLFKSGSTVTAPSGREDDDNSPWYTFGYGSLLSSSSRIISECGLRGQQEDYIEWSLKNLNVDVVFNQEKARCIREKQAKQFIPAEIRGYRRGWYSKGKLPQNDVPENSLFIRPTFLGLLKDERYNTTGLLYSVTKEDLKSTDEREKGAGYLYETLSKNDLRLFTDTNIPENAKIRVYMSAPDHIDSPTKRFPIVQSYVDVFLGGAIEIEENNPDLQNFSLNTCKQTYGWLGGWVNDRPYPRHRAGFLSLSAEKIDNLLYQCMKDNESNEADNITQTISTLRPLQSTDIGEITFPGQCDKKSKTISQPDQLAADTIQTSS